MMLYSVQPRHSIFIKGYRFLSFPKNKYSQKCLSLIKQSATDALKTVLKREI